MSRRLAIAIILALVVGGTAWLLQRSEPALVVMTHAERIVLTGYRENGSLAWSIHAMSGALDTSDSSLETVELTLFRDADSPIIVSGNRLARDSSGSTLTGSVQVDQTDGMSLRTDTLFWDEHNDILESGPVMIEMPEASITAGGFHHNLDTGLTALTRGIEAQINHANTMYEAQADSAEASTDQLSLIGNVTIQNETGDTFTCQRLESESKTSSIRMIGDVVGIWQENEFSAGTMLLGDDGIRLHDNVTTDLNMLMMDESHDT